MNDLHKLADLFDNLANVSRAGGNLIDGFKDIYLEIRETKRQKELLKKQKEVLRLKELTLGLTYNEKLRLYGL